MLPFVLSVPPATDVDPYLAPQPESSELVDVTKDFATLERHPDLEVLALDKTKFFYHMNKLTGVHRLCIPPPIAPEVFAIANGEGHLGFA